MGAGIPAVLLNVLHCRPEEVILSNKIFLNISLFSGLVADNINYDAAFYVSGAFIFLSGFMLIAIPFLNKKYRSSKSDDDSDRLSIHSGSIPLNIIPENSTSTTTQKDTYV